MLITLRLLLVTLCFGLVTLRFGLIRAILVAVLFAAGCVSDARRDTQRGSQSHRWAIAIHGGAGAITRGESPELEAAYRRSLAALLAEGSGRLDSGDSALDVCEAIVRAMEDDELYNAGRGATLTLKGRAELDAAIMDGASMRAGAVAGLTTVKNPISLARRVMESTPHVMLIGAGAEEFAGAAGVERVPNSWFVTDRRRRQLEKELEKRSGHGTGTVGVVALDTSGRLAAATSTGGMTAKMPGRVGDAPIIGAGTYANALVAVSCTGKGEQFIRRAVASGIASRMGLLSERVDQAAAYYVFDVLERGDGGLIALDRSGEIAMPFSSPGMYRAAADSSGRSHVLIWNE